MKGACQTLDAISLSEVIHTFDSSSFIKSQLICIDIAVQNRVELRLEYGLLTVFGVVSS